MRIFLLLVFLAVASHSKFRHLSNITITMPSPPLLKALSPDELAFQYQNTIVMYNPTTKKELQRISQPTQFPVSHLPSSQLLLYSNGNDILQVASNARQFDSQSDAAPNSWLPSMAQYGKTLVAAIYGNAG